MRPWFSRVGEDERIAERVLVRHGVGPEKETRVRYRERDEIDAIIAEIRSIKRSLAGVAL